MLLALRCKNRQITSERGHFSLESFLLLHTHTHSRADHKLDITGQKKADFTMSFKKSRLDSLAKEGKRMDGQFVSLASVPFLLKALAAGEMTPFCG